MMRFSMFKKDHARHAREQALVRALADLPMSFFDSAECQTLRAYPLLAPHTSTLPAWHPAHLFVLSKKTLAYPIAFRMTARSSTYPETPHFDDYAPTPYVWITPKKQLILLEYGRHYLVNPRTINDYLIHEMLIDRLILSLNQDQQALVKIYTDEVVDNIGNDSSL